MPALGEYASVDNTALAVLQQKGYSVWKDEEADMFCARREGWDFILLSTTATIRAFKTTRALQSYG